MDDILKLKEMIDVDTFAPVAKQLQQKAWLMHWSLFVFFNHENGLNALIDLFMQDRWGPLHEWPPCRLCLPVGCQRWRACGLSAMG